MNERKLAAVGKSHVNNLYEGGVEFLCLKSVVSRRVFLFYLQSADTTSKELPEPL